LGRLSQTGREIFVTISVNAALTSSYDYAEVSKSVLIAIVASYAALDLAGRVTAAKGGIRLTWLSCGAIAMGLGIWAMHFKGMLAFRLPVPVEYHWPTVLGSLLLAFLASGVALYVASRKKMSPVAALTGSIFMGAGIAGMHYMGMAAMRLPAVTRFSALLVACSISLAILFSLFALLMAFDLREETRWSVPRKLGSATLMGVAVSAMHYTGMSAASFVPASPPDLSYAVSISPFGNSAVAIASLIMLLAAVTTSSVDRRQSEDRLRRVIDTLPAIVWTKSPDGSADFLNQRFLGYTGLSLEEGLGWGWMRNAFHPEDRAEEEWRAAFAAGQPFEKEARFRRADGAYRWFLLRAVPVRDEQARVIKWYGTTTDIDDRKRAEDELHQAQEDLARVTRVVARGELAPAIAHEVNQPLTAIVTNGNFCLRMLGSATSNPDELRAAITAIVNDGTRASDVIARIRGLLMKGSPNRTDLDINQIIQDVTILLRNEFTRNRVSLRTELPSDLPRVIGDPIQLQQVLINLIMNAIEATRMSTKGRREILIRSAKNPVGVLVQVQDSGTGIKPELEHRIFEPFFTTKAKGVGMGLSISYSIIESHGGRLGIAPSSTGALFEFTLPIDDTGVL
jgi:PAS domain S-box-containing protein